MWLASRGPGRTVAMWGSPALEEKQQDICQHRHSACCCSPPLHTVPCLFTLFPASSLCSPPPHTVPSTTTVKGWALLPTSLWQKASPLLKTSLSLQPLWGVSSSQPPWELPQSWSVPLLPSLGRTLPTPGKGHLCPPS